MSLKQLPEAVQKTIQASGDVAHLKTHQAGDQEWNGVVCYAVEFEKTG